MPTRRPVPPHLKVKDLDHRERLVIRCSCSREIGKQCYDLKLELPGEMLVIRYVSRFRCSVCGGRAEGFVESWPRSGAEGRG